jgi:hypothetical protein
MTGVRSSPPTSAGGASTRARRARMADAAENRSR